MGSRMIALLAGLVMLMAAAIAPVSAQSAPLSPAAEIAIAHLAEEFAPADLEGVVVTDEYTSEHNGVTHVYLQQRHDGTPVSGAVATVNVQHGVVVFSGHRFIHDLAAHVSGEQAVSAATAVDAAISAVDAARDEAVSAPTLVYRSGRDGTARLAYRVQVHTEDLWGYVYVDAATGRTLGIDDFTDHHASPAHIAARTARAEDTPVVRAALSETILPPERAEDGSSYNVFPMPMESPIDGDRSVVENPADAVASPFGWHDTDGQPGPEHTITRGNNADAYHDTIGATVSAGALGMSREPVAGGNEADPLSQPDGGDGLDFDFPIPTYDATPLIYRDAAVTNLFFWNNVMHDVTFRYGFDEKAGNFQTTNYSGEGVGGDHVLAEAQDGTYHAPSTSPPVLNANFATPPEGSSGRMQMYLWVDAFRALVDRDVARVPSHQVRDGDLDNGVIAHEYGHGISNRLVGGPSNVSCLRTHDEREGEGWSDWWSFVLTMRDGDDGATPRGVGNYVVYFDEHGRAGKGVRITPYSTDMEINPSTYDTIRNAAEPHGVGYVWASMLWDLYWNLVERHGFNPNPYESWETGGNNLAMQLVVDGMKFAPCEPGFVDARDAIIAADAALTGDVANGVPGTNECLIWETFARRGLGFSADQGDPHSKVDGIEGYDVPSHCVEDTGGDGPGNGKGKGPKKDLPVVPPASDRPAHGS